MKINNLILDDTKYTDILNFFGYRLTSCSKKEYEVNKKIFTDKNILETYKNYGKNVGPKVNFILRSYHYRGDSSSKNMNSILESYQRDKNSITVIFLGNEGFDYMPFTPWILFHRFFHAIHIGNTTSDFVGGFFINSYIPEIINFGKELLEIYGKYIDISYHKKFKLFEFEFFEIKNTGLVPAPAWIFKFKSAKNTRLLTLDVYAELFAQFCTNRKITFTRELPNFLTEHEKSTIIQIHEKYEKEITNFFIKLEQKLIGNAFMI